MIFTDAKKSSLAFPFYAPANRPMIIIGIIPIAVTAEFLYFIGHTLIYLNLITNIFFFNHEFGHMPFCGLSIEILSIFFSTT